MDRARDVVLLGPPGADGSGVRVAILDTGLDVDHPDFAGRIDLGESRSVTPHPDITDYHGHGTHVAGIIAGDGTCSNGRFQGIAPATEIVVYRVSRGRRAIGMDTAKAVEHAINAGVDIINFSAGEGGPFKPPWVWPQKLGPRDRAFREAAEQGVLVVAAAGNEGPEPGSINRPAALSDVLAVGALSRARTVTESSSRGPVFVDPGLRKARPQRLDLATQEASRLIPPNLVKPDLVAPGGYHDLTAAEVALHHLVPLQGIASCLSRDSINYRPIDPAAVPGRGYTRIHGSSQATAVVSGLAALLLDLGRRLGMPWGGNVGAALAAILREAAAPLKTGSDRDFGYGLPVWEAAKQTMIDCVRDEVRRQHVLEGPQLKLL